jgi:hypothetical protein
MPTITQDAIPTDADELAFLRRVFQPVATIAPDKRKRDGAFAASDPARGPVPPRQHILAAANQAM